LPLRSTLSLMVIISCSPCIFDATFEVLLEVQVSNLYCRSGAKIINQVE